MKLYAARDSRFDILYETSPYYQGENRDGHWFIDVPVSEFYDISMEAYGYSEIVGEILSEVVSEMTDEIDIENATNRLAETLREKIKTYLPPQWRHHLLNTKLNTNQGIWIQVSGGHVENEDGDRPWFNLVRTGYWNRKPQVYTQNNAGEVTRLPNQCVLDKSTGRLEYYRELEQQRPYVRCVICDMFNKYRTNMMPVYNQQSRWSGRKNICIECVADYATDPDRSVGFDGDKQLTLSNTNSFSHLDYYDRDDLTRLSGDFGRAFRKMKDYLIADSTTDWQWVTINKCESVDIPTWSYNFDTTMHSWNWRFPIFLTTARPYGDSGSAFFESHSLGYDWQDPSWYGNTGPYFGAEFECFVRNDRQDMRRNIEVKKTAIKMFHPTDYPTAYTQDAEHQLLYAKEDGSLNEGDGIEFVSQPLSYDYWMNHVPDRFWEYFRNNFRARNSSQCGIHVHLGWDSMDVVQRYIFLYFLNRMNLSSSELLQRVAGRGSTYYSVWNSLVYQGSRDQVFQVALEKTQTGDNPKYNSINTRHADTIELRYFQGNTGENSIKGIFQFINGLYRISDELANPYRDWKYLEEEQPEELQFLLEGIKGQTDSTFLRQLMNTERLTADEIKYFVNRVGIDWIRTKLNDDEYGYMADRYLDVPSI
jgi:hypothetical protein